MGLNIYRQNSVCLCKRVCTVSINNLSVTIAGHCIAFGEIYLTAISRALIIHVP